VKGIKTEWLSLGGAYGSQAAAMKAARQRGAPFCDT